MSWSDVCYMIAGFSIGIYFGPILEKYKISIKITRTDKKRIDYDD